MEFTGEVLAEKRHYLCYALRGSLRLPLEVSRSGISKMSDEAIVVNWVREDGDLE